MMSILSVTREERTHLQHNLSFSLGRDGGRGRKARQTAGAETKANVQEQGQVGTPELGHKRFWSGTERFGNRTLGKDESAGESCGKQDNLAI